MNHAVWEVCKILSARYLPGRTKIVWGIRILAGLAVCALTFCWTFHVWGPSDWRAFVGMSRECHPSWWKVHWGQVYPGQDVEEAIRRTEPLSVVCTGRYTRLTFQPSLSFTGLVITARDGKVVSAVAGSCCWERVFFDGMTREDHAEWYREGTSTSQSCGPTSRASC